MWQYTVAYSSDELYHHGVKGQKHGVRRWQYKNGSLTPEGYVHYGYGHKRKGSEDDTGHKRNSANDTASRLEGKSGYVLKKGSVSRRITTNKDEQLTGERKYTTTNKHDDDIYLDFYPTELANYSRGENKQDFIYRKEYETNKDIIVADGKAYADAFLELMNSDKDAAAAIGYRTKKKLFENRIDFNRKNQAAREEFDYELQRRNNATNDKFFDILRKKGYDAVEDQFSKAIDGTDSATIFLNPDKDLKEKRTNVILDKKYGNMYRDDETINEGEVRSYIEVPIDSPKVKQLVDKGRKQFMDDFRKSDWAEDIRYRWDDWGEGITERMKANDNIKISNVDEYLDFVAGKWMDRFGINVA